MRYLKMDSIEPGMQLARNIDMYTENGKKMTLVQKGTYLSQSVINALLKKSCKGMYINDDLSKDIQEIPSTIGENSIHATMQLIKGKNIEAILSKAHEFVEDILSAKEIDIDLNRIMNNQSVEGEATNVCEFALIMGSELGYSQQALKDLASSALLVNLGKFLTKEVTEKYGLLEPYEIRRKKMNIPINQYYCSYYAYQYLSEDVTNRAVIKQAILFSRENDNGTGYPFGLTGEAPHMKEAAKILHICLLYNEHLNKVGSSTEARALLQQDFSERLVDRELTQLFLKIIPIYAIGETVTLSTGEEAIVLKNNKNLPETPIVRTVSGEIIDLSETVNITILQEIKEEALEEVKRTK